MNVRDLLDLPRSVFEGYCQEKARYAYLGKSVGMATILGKYKVFVDTEDTSLVPHLIADGCWEPWVTLALRNVKEGWFAVDIGANHGYYSAILGELTGKTVVAFEPQEAMVALMTKTFSANGTKVELIQGGVGAEGGVGYLKFEKDESQKGSVSIADGGTIAGDGLTAVEMYSLDQDLSVTPDFIKIDAEGAEPEIWRGMRRILESRPTILMEFSPSLYPDAAGFLQDIEACYSLREVDHDGNIVPVAAETVLERPDFSMLWLEKD